MNKQHLKVMKMFKLNRNLTIMGLTNYNKYLKTTTTQRRILYNRTHTNNGKKSTTNKNKLKDRQSNNNKTKLNLKFINNRLTKKFIKTTQIMKCGKMITTWIHILQRPTLMKLIVIKITAGKVKSNIMTVDRKILMELKWRKWTLITVRKIIKSKHIPLKINKIYLQIIKKINSCFSPFKWKTKNPVIGAIKMIKTNNQLFLPMLEPELPIGIQTLQI